MITVEFATRCATLRRRGLSRDLVHDLKTGGDTQLLEQLEQATDAELAELTRLDADRRTVANTLTRFLGDELSDHEPCADCVRCATCRREWCPTVEDRCPGEKSWWMHPTGGMGRRDDEYCYRCTVCEGGYFQFHDPAHPACTEVKQEPHVIADGRGSE